MASAADNEAEFIELVDDAAVFVTPKAEGGTV
jgi:hypothetical protein